MEKRKTQGHEMSDASFKHIQWVLNKAREHSTLHGEGVMFSYSRGHLHHLGGPSVQIVKNTFQQANVQEEPTYTKFVNEVRIMELHQRMEDLCKQITKPGFDMGKFTLRELEEFKGKLLQILKLVAKPSIEPHSG